MHTTTHSLSHIHTHACTTTHTDTHTHTQLQAVILLVDTGATLSEVSVKQLYTLPPSLQLGVVPPLSIPTAIHGLVSTLNDGEDWFPLDKQLLWKHLRHKVVSLDCTVNRA